MKTLGIFILLVLCLDMAHAQNRDTATVAIAGYRLHENVTYSWRNTNTYFDRTPWDSSPYTEGHLRHLNGMYRLNYRLLFPNNYDSQYEGGYPLMLVFHGAGERGNCWNKGTTMECYYGDWNYNPNTQPVDATEDQINNLLNNDHSLAQGGGAHLSARNRAGTKLPGDPTLHERAFPGFVFYPQNLNGWSVSSVRDAIRTLRLLMKKYNIDQDRIYVSGLSNGGRGALFAMVEADWLFAAAATQSAIPDHNAYKSEIDSVVNIPIWMFQGAQDTYPLPVHTTETIRVLRAAGGFARYTEYPTIGHGTWNTAYAEPDYFQWFLTRNKSDLHVYYGNPNVCGTNAVGAKLSMPQGFAGYEWERDGVIIPGATGYILVADEAGVYRGRFRRGAVWNNWSSPVNIGVESPVTPTLTQVGSVILRDLNGKNTATLQGPEGATYYYWYKDNVLTTLPNTRTVQVRPGDCSAGPCANNGVYTVVTAQYNNCPSQPSNPKGVFFNDQAPLTIPVPTGFTGTLNSPTEVVLRWNDVSALERGYEVWRRRSTDDSSIGWTFVTITAEDAILYVDRNLQPNTTYWYKIRAVSNSARSNYAPGNGKSIPAQNLIISTGNDTSPPTAPANLTADVFDTDIATKTVSIRLTWTAGTDDTGITEYRIQYGSTTVTVPATPTAHTLTGVALNRDLSVSVSAVDFAGNVSPPSSPARVSTYIDGFFWYHSTGGFTDIRDVPPTVWTNPEFRGRSANLTLEPRTQEDYFTMRFYGYIFVSTAGNYLFRVSSNDGIQLYLDGQLVSRRNGLVTDGSCPVTNFNPGVPPAALSQGIHTLEIRYFQYTGDKCLSIQWRGPDAGRTAGKFYDLPDSRIRSYESYTPPLPPEVPVDFAAVAEGMSRINLSWTYPATDSVGFEIQRALAEEGPFTVVNRVQTLAYADTALLPGTTYYYRLRSINNAGTSAFTPVVSATTGVDTEAPTAPVNLTLVSKTITTASIAWTASSDNTGVTGYEIYANGVRVETTPQTFHLLENLIPFSTYSVYVVAYDAGNNKSQPSNTIVFETVEPVVYFSKATGNLNDLATWGPNADGSGEPPSSFDLSGLFLNIANRTTTNIGGNWSVPSPTARVIVYPGVTLTAESVMNATVNTSENSMVIVANPNAPNFDEVSLTSTVQYNPNVTLVKPGVYGNLVLTGTGTKTFPAGEVGVAGNLSVATGLSLKGAAANASRITLWGNATFSGVRTAPPADVTIGLRFAGTSPQTLTTEGDLDFFELSVQDGNQVSVATGGAVVNIRTGSVNGGGIVLENNSVFDLGANTLSIGGAGTINRGNQSGSIKIRNGSIQLASSNAGNSNLYLDPTDNNVYYLSSNISGAGSLIARSPVNIIHGLKIANGTVNSNGLVRLVSTAEKTANLEAIENNGRIIGDVNVERYIPLKERTYRYMSSPVEGITVADWQRFFKITGAFEGASTGPGLSSAYSLFVYDNPNWTGYPTTSNAAPIERGVGYAAFLRNSSAFTMTNIGNPYQGEIPFVVEPPAGTDGWNLLGNPYASTIRWNNTNWVRSDIGSIVAVRNNFDATSGQFMYYDANTGLGTGSEGTLTGGKVAPGQAFYVQAIGPSPTLTITEQAKIQDQQTYFRDDQRLISHLYLKLKGGDREDVAIVSFSEKAKDEFEIAGDGTKMKNVGMFNLSTSVDNQLLAINNLSDSWCSRNIRVSIDDVAPGTYTLYTEDLSSLIGAGSVQLIDNFAGKEVDLKKSSAYTFEVSSDEKSFGSTRFEIIIDRPELDLNIQPVSSASCNEDGKILLDRSQHGATYSIFDKSGNVVAVQTGNGSELHFIVPASQLSEGANEFRIEASFKGCQAAPLSSSAVLNYARAPLILSEDVSTCKGESAALTVETNVAATRFIWYSENGNEIKGASQKTLQTDPIDTETFYFVSAEGSGGCIGPKQIITVTPVDIAAPVLSRTADTLYADSHADLYKWALDGEEIAVTYVPYFGISEAGKYTVTCVSGGCSKISSALEVTAYEIGNQKGNISIYPNPTTSDNISVRGFTSAEGSLSVTVMDVLGRDVYTTETTAEALAEGIRIQPRTNLKAGIYFLVVEENSKKRKIRFIVRD